jgi:hypothetical protein
MTAPLQTPVQPGYVPTSGKISVPMPPFSLSDRLACYASRLKAMRLTIIFAVIATLMGILVAYADVWQDQLRHDPPKYGDTTTLAR